VIGIGITGTALTDAAGDTALQRRVHEELLEDLAVHGRLVFTSQEHVDQFVAAVARLPSSLAKAWETVLSSKRVSVTIHEPPLTEALSEVLEPDLLDSALAPDVQLVLLDSDQAELLGVADGEFSMLTPRGLVEIGRIATAGRTASLLTARQLLDAPLREGVNRDVEWTERFGPLSDGVTPIVVYDKFAGRQVVRRQFYGQRGVDGLSWFLGKLSTRQGRRVRVITAVTDELEKGRPVDERTIALAFSALSTQLSQRQLKLDLVLVPERGESTGHGRPAARFGHDRHIRFGERAALAVGTGMQAFSNQTFRETISVGRLPVSDARAREELAVKAALRPPEGGWLAWRP
jgi:hypothetical protein